MHNGAAEFNTGKAQSTGEYIAAYVLIIVVAAVVLAVLFSSGILSNRSNAHSGCTPNPGFLCSNAVISESGILTVTVGQEIAPELSDVDVYFVPGGGNLKNAAVTSLGTLNEGQNVTVRLQLPFGSPYPSAYTYGNSIEGYVYIGFTEEQISHTDELGSISTIVQSNATTALSGMPTNVSGILAYVPITIKNSQNATVNGPFQQVLQLPESSYSKYIAYNGTFANFEFFYANGTIIPAWIESNSSGLLTIWLKLAKGMPASSSVTAYLGFASKTTNLLSGGGPIGEAPQLSPSYAGYDDGADVFLHYFNMQKDPVSSSYQGRFAKTAAMGPLGNYQPVLVWNGSKGNEIAFINLASPLPSSFIVTGWIKTNKNPWDIGLGAGSNSAGKWDGYSADPGEGNNTNFAIWETSGSTWSREIASVPYRMNTSRWYTVEFQYVSGGAMTGWVEPFENTLDASSSSEKVAATDRTYTSFDAVELTPYSTVPSYVTYWALITVRAYPPNGVMPSVSFGALQKVSASSM
ncbi:MAG: hypothetical protein ACP5K9_00080 [Candidatus Micrarchaeia archaeon]